MPQLSPLNWIFLFMLFWIAVLCMSVLIWWSKKVYFHGENMKFLYVKKNKWNW
uniref:ATP synthase F0 subunit 8 n=1 Tax=Capulus dilatatus TaxID=3090832 RepID=UPI002A83D09B|nr:ATP synthase F0 subunit 8 [Capulus dilatatus]WOW98757.1 ATP synthase F0 subunit 8 [Capulus dilatatus]